VSQWMPTSLVVSSYGDAALCLRGRQGLKPAAQAKRQRDIQC
jgi:hypothetical protein